MITGLANLYIRPYSFWVHFPVQHLSLFLSLELLILPVSVRLFVQISVRFSPLFLWDRNTEKPLSVYHPGWISLFV